MRRWSPRPAPYYSAYGGRSSHARLTLMLLRLCIYLFMQMTAFTYRLYSTHIHVYALVCMHVILYVQCILCTYMYIYVIASYPGPPRLLSFAVWKAGRSGGFWNVRDITWTLGGQRVGVSEVKDRLPLLISIVISPVVDKLQEYGKEQWNAEELLQLQSRSNGEQQRDGWKTSVKRRGSMS